MNKKVLIVIGLVIILAAGGYYLSTRPSSTPEPQSMKQIVKESVEWAKAIESGKPTSCVMSKAESQMEYYLEGKKMRADITTSVEGKAQLSHMINDGAYLYIWSDGQTQGSKTAIPTEDEVKQLAEDAKKYQDQTSDTPDFTSESAYDNLETQGYTINCQGVSADASKLTPPSTVTFIDPSEMMKKVAPEGNGVDIQKLQEMAKQYQTNE